MKISGIKKYFSPVEEEGSRINNFNIIRLIAAAMVIYGHMGSIMGVTVHGFFGQAVSSLAVMILFTISGYLIMKSLMSDNNFGRYMIRRTFRIFPALIGVVLFSVFIVGPIFTADPVADYFKNPNTWLYFKNLLLSPVYGLPGVFGNYTYPVAVNGALWTLPFEFALYLILPLFLRIFKKCKIEKIGLAVITLVTVAVSFYYTRCAVKPWCVVWGSDLWSGTVLLPYFFMGALYAFPEFKKLLNLQMGILFMILLAIFSFNSVKTSVLLNLALPYFVLSLALCPKPIFSKWFVKSDFSYGLYLYGFVIQQIVCHQTAKLNSGIFSMNVNFVICFAITFVCAVVSWYLIEKPMQKLGKKLCDRIK